MMYDDLWVKAVLQEREREFRRTRLIAEAENARAQTRSNGRGWWPIRARTTEGRRSARPHDHATWEMITMRATELASHIEHAVLAPQTTQEDVTEAARVALRWEVRALVVKPCHVSAATRLLTNSGVKVVTVIGFPHGGQTTETKVQETRQAVAAGAQELDMVVNIGALRQRQTAAVFYEIRAVVEAAEGRPVKVILENAYLTDTQKRLACRLAVRAGAAYVKTSTGFAPRGATSADVALMRRTVPRSVHVKAAGGIRTYADAVALLQAGADVLGTSATDAILSEAASEAA